MTAFVILAAGRGSRIGRVGDSLHKALVPLEGKAIISHLFDLAPPDADIIVCLGHRGQQIKDYVTLAHPDRIVTFVDVPSWDRPGGGPGHSLLSARSRILKGEDLAFTSCDTLWEADPSLWEASSSWTAVAPMPVGTSPNRWCRIVRGASGRVVRVLDKNGVLPDHTAVYTGLSFIKADDLELFWHGVQGGAWLQNEKQVSGGLTALADKFLLDSRDIHWTDVGDEAAYHRAVIERQGYDWTKEREATWVLPDTRRVVKFWADERQAQNLLRRATYVGRGLPVIKGSARTGMIAYEYVDGIIGYEAVKTAGDMDRLLQWAAATVWREAKVPEDEQLTACKDFYYTKTVQRIGMLRPELQAMSFDAVSRINWEEVVSACRPVRWHGDLNLGNVIWDGRAFVGIDWRGDFAGHDWGDQRYDLAKLLVGCRIHWERAMKGDFTPFREGKELEETIRRVYPIGRDTEMIAALTLLNSAPLHESPLDEVLVVHAAKWLEDLS
jgi:NDP-sugar pyrophosphorylase family protein